MKNIFPILLLVLCSYLANGQDCEAILYEEGFTMDVPPTGWTGDFSTTPAPLIEGWYTTSGPTTTMATGPEVPAAGTHFAYMESSGPAPSNSTFRIQTPIVSIPTDGTTALSLSFLMFGSDIGSFEIQVLDGNSIDPIFMRSGEQHSDGTLGSWEAISLDLSAYAGSDIQIQFQGMKLISGLGDIGIDEIIFCPCSRTHSDLRNMGINLININSGSCSHNYCSPRSSRLVGGSSQLQ